VVRQITGSGIKKIGRLASGRGKTLLIRAHGSSIDVFRKARKFGYHIVDATCPMVKEIHRIAKDMERKSYSIIIIGDKKHDEVRGIVGQLKKKAIVIERLDDITAGKVGNIKKAVIVAQSTQNLQKVLAIVEQLRSRIDDIQFFNTICRPTRLKQEEIKTMPLKNDVMIIIGSKTSANTKRLYEISKSINRRSYWVGSKKEIKPGWFKDAASVGVTAGASTPDSTTQDIVRYIKQIAKK
jgi:4-hydroxy-3-methylbut-2-enyl diphosphate reductase